MNFDEAAKIAMSGVEMVTFKSPYSARDVAISDAINFAIRGDIYLPPEWETRWSPRQATRGATQRATVVAVQMATSDALKEAENEL